MTSEMDAKPFLWLVAMSKHNVKLVKRFGNLVGQYPMTYVRFSKLLKTFRVGRAMLYAGYLPAEI